MYNPKYIPQLTDETVEIPKLKFELLYSNTNLENHDFDPLHIHNDLELFINLSDKVSFWVNDKIYSVEYGDIIISRPGDVHMCIFPDIPTHEHTCIWLRADTSHPIFSFIFEKSFSPHVVFNDKEKILSSVKSLQYVCENNSSELIKVFRLLEIFADIYNNSNTKNSDMPHILPEEFQKIITDIKKNYTQYQSVNDILNSNFISSSTLTRQFRKYMHTTPKIYLENVKLSNAIRLLKNNSSVTEACFKSGFTDCSHFIAIFKKRFGLTPLQYKKTLSNTEN